MTNVHVVAHLMTHLLVEADQLHFLLPVALLEPALQR